MSHWIKVLITNWVFYESLLSYSLGSLMFHFPNKSMLSDISNSVLVCGLLPLYFHTHKGWAIVFLELGNNLPMDSHSIGVSIVSLRLSSLNAIRPGFNNAVGRGYLLALLLLFNL